MLWLDVTNPYGSIPHKLVDFALTRYQAPEKIHNLVLDYYNNFSLRVSSGTSTSAWHRLEKGIIIGCMISVCLFALAVNMLGKLFTSDLKDAAAHQATSNDVTTWLSAVRSGLPGKSKAWIYQLLWPMVIYEIPISTAESFERKINHFMRRWLGPAIPRFQ